MTCVLFAFHSQQVKQSAYDNLAPLLTTSLSSLVMDVPVLDLRPVWRSSRSFCHFSSSFCSPCWQYWNSSHTSQPTSFSTSHLKV